MFDNRQVLDTVLDSCPEAKTGNMSPKGLHERRYSLDEPKSKAWPAPSGLRWAYPPADILPDFILIILTLRRGAD